MTDKSISFLLPGTAVMAIGLMDDPTPFGGETAFQVETRGARYGMSFIITAPKPVAQKILAALKTRATPDGTMGQPSSWGHGCRKAVPRLTAALAGEGA